MSQINIAAPDIALWLDGKPATARLVRFRYFDMVKLMNSAMMPQAGRYECEVISVEDFVSTLQAYKFVSYIGYEATARHIESIAGVAVTVSRAETQFQNGDVALVCRLNFRLADPKRKADRNYVPAPEDYEYLRVMYYANFCK